MGTGSWAPLFNLKSTAAEGCHLHIHLFPSLP